MEQEHRDAIIEVLRSDHWEWKGTYNWVGIEAMIDDVACHFGCTVSELRGLMTYVERRYPKPRRKPLGKGGDTGE